MNQRKLKKAERRLKDAYRAEIKEIREIGESALDEFDRCNKEYGEGILRMSEPYLLKNQAGGF